MADLQLFIHAVQELSAAMPAAAEAAEVSSHYMSKLGGALAASVTALAAAWGISKLASAALEGIARQPEASDSLKGAMILAAALIEGVALFAVVVALLAVVS